MAFSMRQYAVVALLWALVASPAALAVQCDVIGDKTMTKVFYGDSPAGFEQVAFDDSAFRMGYFPMGSCPTCDELERFRPLFWFPGASVITTRTTLTLAAAPVDGSIEVRAGNKAWVYVNGVHIGDVHNGGCSHDLDGFPVVTLAIPAGLLVAGNNVIVVKAQAETHESFLDINILVEAATCEGLISVTCPAFEDKKTIVLFVDEATNPRPDDWNLLDLDESNFVMGMFPLANAESVCNELKCNPIGTAFPLESTLATRNKFFLTKIPDAAKVRVIADNSAWVYVNGVHIGDVHWRDCAWSFEGVVFDIDVSILNEGQNILAVTGRDTGGSSYLDVELSVTSDECVIGEPTPTPTPVPEPCTNTFANPRCRRLRDEGKCDLAFVLRNCQMTCNPDCATEPTPTPVPCENILTNGRCNTLKNEGKCDRAYVLRKCQMTCNPDCEEATPTPEPTPTPDPCTNIFSNARCRTLRRDGKCGRAYVMRNCAETCDPDCDAAQPTDPPEPCTNVFANGRCNTLAAEGKCERPFVLNRCQMTCNPECTDPCSGQCRGREACIVKGGRPYCVDCSIFIIGAGRRKEHCCKANANNTACVANTALNNVCMRDMDLTLHLVAAKEPTFKRATGAFCGSFIDFKRNGGAFPVKEH